MEFEPCPLLLGTLTGPWLSPEVREVTNRLASPNRASEGSSAYSRRLQDHLCPKSAAVWNAGRCYVANKGSQRQIYFGKGVSNGPPHCKPPWGPQPASARRECPQRQQSMRLFSNLAHWGTCSEAESKEVRALNNTLGKAFVAVASPFTVLPLPQRQRSFRTLVCLTPLLLQTCPNPADLARERQNEEEEGRVNQRLGEGREGRTEGRRERET